VSVPCPYENRAFSFWLEQILSGNHRKVEERSLDRESSHGAVMSSLCFSVCPSVNQDAGVNDLNIPCFPDLACTLGIRTGGLVYFFIWLLGFVILRIKPRTLHRHTRH
jgi:hypothetical protein